MNAKTAGNLSQGNTRRSVEEQGFKGPLTGRGVPPVKSDLEKGDKKAPGAFRTISEVAEDLDVQQHVLRFWETKFSQIRPLKRGGGRRYYRPEDLALLKKIHHLLYTEGYTIKGVQKLLREKGKNALLQDDLSALELGEQTQLPSQASVSKPAQKSVQASVQGSVSFGLSPSQKATLQETLLELKELRNMMSSG